MLKFGRANAKLESLEKIVGRLYTFSLLSGHTCPFAKNCLSRAIRVNGKAHIEDGPDTLFRCFSASEEAIYPNVYDSRERNYHLLSQCSGDISEMTNLILSSIPADAKCIRVHVGGDFFSMSYFRAWMQAALESPHILFYAYTKSLPFFAHAKRHNAIPSNFVLTASRGGKRDELITQEGLREAVVIADVETCKAIVDSGNHDIVPSGVYAGYEIDHDDRHAALPELKHQPFALLVHNVQPKGSQSAEAKNVLNGVGSYKRNK